MFRFIRNLFATNKYMELEVYECSNGDLPDHLKRIYELRCMGLEPIAKPVAIHKIFDSKFYLYDISKTRSIFNQSIFINESNKEIVKKENKKENPIEETVIEKPLNQEKAKLTYEERARINRKIQNDLDLDKKVEWLEIEERWLSHREDYYILDIATTGFTKDDEIIQLSLIDFYGNTIYNQYFNPSRDSHPEAFKNHQLTKKFLSQFPSWSDEWFKIQDLLKAKTLIAHHNTFHMRLIEQTCKKYHLTIEADIHFECSMDYTKQKYTLRSLSKVLDYLQIEDYTYSSALGDCFKFLRILNPHEEIFYLQSRAKNLFLQSIEKKKALGYSDAEEKAYNWLKQLLRYSNTNIQFECLDLKECQSIIKKLDTKKQP